jgi:hypothetical protein
MVHIRSTRPFVALLAGLLFLTTGEIGFIPAMARSTPSAMAVTWDDRPAGQSSQEAIALERPVG